MKSVVSKYIISAAFSIVAVILFILGVFMIYSSKDDGLFFEPESAITEENANLIQGRHPEIKGIITSFVNESLAERARLKAIKKLWISLGEFLLLISFIQIGSVAVFLFLHHSSAVRK